MRAESFPVAKAWRKCLSGLLPEAKGPSALFSGLFGNAATTFSFFPIFLRHAKEQNHLIFVRMREEQNQKHVAWVLVLMEIERVS